MREVGHDAAILVGEVGRERRQVDREEAQRVPDLRRGEADAGRADHRLDHVVDQALKLGAVAGDVHGALPQDGLTVRLDRENHGLGVGTGPKLAATRAGAPAFRGVSRGLSPPRVRGGRPRGGSLRG